MKISLIMKFRLIPKGLSGWILPSSCARWAHTRLTQLALPHKCSHIHPTTCNNI